MEGRKCHQFGGDSTTIDLTQFTTEILADFSIQLLCPQETEQEEKEQQRKVKNHTGVNILSKSHPLLSSSSPSSSKARRTNVSSRHLTYQYNHMTHWYQSHTYHYPTGTTSLSVSRALSFSDFSCLIFSLSLFFLPFPPSGLFLSCSVLLIS